jgi:hypothetical protein
VRVSGAEFGRFFETGHSTSSSRTVFLLDCDARLAGAL